MRSATRYNPHLTRGYFAGFRGVYSRRECTVVKAVLVEDDALTRITLSELLESEGFSVRAFGDTDEALRQCLADPPHILLTDLCVPGSLTTYELVRYIRDASRETKILFISGYNEEDIHCGGLDLADIERHPKPIDFDSLILSLKSSLVRPQEQRTLDERAP